MFRGIFAIVGAVSLSLVVLAGPAAGTPNDGNGNKFVDSGVFGPFPVECEDTGDVLELVIDFTVQVRERDNGGNVFVATYIVNEIYSNDAGETWVFIDRGVDRGYLVDGVLHIAVIGRSGFGNIGHLVFLPDGGDVVFQKGQPVDPRSEACARLG